MVPMAMLENSTSTFVTNLLDFEFWNPHNGTYIITIVKQVIKNKTVMHNNFIYVENQIVKYIWKYILQTCYECKTCNYIVYP